MVSKPFWWPRVFVGCSGSALGLSGLSSGSSTRYTEVVGTAEGCWVSAWQFKRAICLRF